MCRLYYVSMVDIIKNNIVGNFFNKEIEFTVVQLDHRLFRVYIIVVRDFEVTTNFWSTLSLQQFNQFKGALGCPPPSILY